MILTNKTAVHYLPKTYYKETAKCLGFSDISICRTGSGELNVAVKGPDDKWSHKNIKSDITPNDIEIDQDIKKAIIELATEDS